MKENKLPRGIRNNNPLNIRRGHLAWEGEVFGLEGVPLDTTFCQFKSMEWGWRAAFLLLRRYIEEYKCNTVRKIISRWAPSNENDTERYVSYVANSVREGADGEIEFKSLTILLIASAMCEMENGIQYSPLKTMRAFSAMIEGRKMVN